MGYVDLRDLLSASAYDLIAQYVETNVISVPPEADQEEAAQLVSKYDLKAIPVVSNGRILGIITVDDIIDVIEKEHDEDMLQMAGASMEEDLDTPLFTSIRLRLPWLIINLLTAFFASSVVNLFQGTIAQVVALSAIMTIISGMGGNAGTQTMSIIIRYLSKDAMDRNEARGPMVKEILSGVINGLIIGLITAIVVVVVYKNIFLSGIVILAMIGNMVIGGVFGLAIPVLLKKFGFDPAISSSIFFDDGNGYSGLLPAFRACKYVYAMAFGARKLFHSQKALSGSISGYRNRRKTRPLFQGGDLTEPWKSGGSHDSSRKLVVFFMPAHKNEGSPTEGRGTCLIGLCRQNSFPA